MKLIFDFKFKVLHIKNEWSLPSLSLVLFFFNHIEFWSICLLCSLQFGQTVCDLRIEDFQCPEWYPRVVRFWQTGLKPKLYITSILNNMLNRLSRLSEIYIPSTINTNMTTPRWWIWLTLVKRRRQLAHLPAANDAWWWSWLSRGEKQLPLVRGAAAMYLNDPVL